jgi:hypothetical protein
LSQFIDYFIHYKASMCLSCVQSWLNVNNFFLFVLNWASLSPFCDR